MSIIIKNTFETNILNIYVNEYNKYNNDVNITPSSNVNYVRKNVQKKKATIKITDEVRFAIIIVGILLVFVFFFPDIIKFFRKIFLGLNR